MSTLNESAPPATADTSSSKADGHYYEYIADTKKWVPLYVEGGTVKLSNAREWQAAGRLVVPSVTGILSVMRKYSIEDYGKKQAAKAALRNPRDQFATEEEWLDKVLAEADGASRGAMDLGTRVHGAVESFLLGKDYNADMQQYVNGIVAAMNEHGVHSDPSPEECAGSLRYGVAGKFDIVHRGTTTVCDIKTRGHKLNKKKPSRVPYYETDTMQVAAGGYFIFGNRFFTEGRGIIFGTSTIQPGLVTAHVFTGPELVEAFSTFIALTQVWRFVNNADFRVKGAA